MEHASNADHLILRSKYAPIYPRQIIGATVGFSLMLVLMALFGLWMDPPKTRKEELSLLIGMPVILLWPSLFFFFFLCSLAGRTWRIDEEGIEFVPIFKKSRYLRWRDVERVCLTEKGPSSAWGKGMRIPMPCGVIDEASLSEGKRRIAEILSPDFDLEYHSRDVLPLSKAASYRLLAGLLLMMGLAFTVSFAVSRLITDDSLMAMIERAAIPLEWYDSIARGAGISVVGIFVACIAWAVIRLRREDREWRRVNPAWRTRKSASSGSPGAE